MTTIVPVATVTPGTFVRFGELVGRLSGARCVLPSSEPGYLLHTHQYGTVEVGPNATVELLTEAELADVRASANAADGPGGPAACRMPGSGVVHACVGYSRYGDPDGDLFFNTPACGVGFTSRRLAHGTLDPVTCPECIALPANHKAPAPASTTARAAAETRS